MLIIGKNTKLEKILTPGKNNKDKKLAKKFYSQEKNTEKMPTRVKYQVGKKCQLWGKNNNPGQKNCGKNSFHVRCKDFSI